MDNINKLTEKDFKDNYVPKNVSSSIKYVWKLLLFLSILTLIVLVFKDPLAYADVIVVLILSCLMLLLKSRIIAFITIIYHIISFCYCLYNDFLISGLESILNFEQYMWGIFYISTYFLGVKAIFKYQKLRKLYFTGELSPKDKIENVQNYKTKGKNISKFPSYNITKDQ
jgi:hypothetical protein